MAADSVRRGAAYASGVGPEPLPALIISAGPPPGRRPPARAACSRGWPPTGAPSPSAPGVSQLNTLRRIASRMAGPGWLGGVHPLLFAAPPLPFLRSPPLGRVPPADGAQAPP